VLEGAITVFHHMTDSTTRIGAQLYASIEAEIEQGSFPIPDLVKLSYLGNSAKLVEELCAHNFFDRQKNEVTIGINEEVGGKNWRMLLHVSITAIFSVQMLVIISFLYRRRTKHLYSSQQDQPQDKAEISPTPSEESELNDALCTILGDIGSYEEFEEENHNTNPRSLRADLHNLMTPSSRRCLSDLCGHCKGEKMQPVILPVSEEIHMFSGDENESMLWLL